MNNDRHQDSIVPERDVGEQSSPNGGNHIRSEFDSKSVVGFQALDIGSPEQASRSARDDAPHDRTGLPRHRNEGVLLWCRTLPGRKRARRSRFTTSV